ncbi:glycosyltransferase [Devosia submarina]|uniref:glycosyltransferase n=1 Tax=Devosia submarina TaxID=1173082 RepID=UPI0014729BF9|nr:glycosyltransferase [Devosia submarina]
MRIAMFFWSLELGGVEHMMVELSRELATRGHDVTLVLARLPQPHEYSPDPRVHTIRLGATNIVSTISLLARHLRAAQYDILYTAMPTSNVAAVAALKLSGANTRLVISERSNPKLEAQHSQSWRYRAAFTLQPFAYPQADAIVAVSNDLADDLARFARLQRHTLRVIYNPAFSGETAPVTASTHPWLDDKAGPVIIGAGRFLPQKDWPTLLRAFAKLRERRHAKLIILGEGPLRHQLIQLGADLGISDHLTLPGFDPKISPYLEKADVFALSSLWEGFGNVLVQALGAGCSIVATDCPNGPGEILDRGQFGHLVATGDHHAFAEALDRAIQHPFDPARQRARATLFSTEKSADAYEALFGELIAKAS